MSDTTNINQQKQTVHGSQINAGGDVTVRITNNYPPPEFPLDNLPPPNLAFTGRQEHLASIVTNFSGSANPPVVLMQVIAGLGGVGKTQVALAYAHVHKNEYDLIWQLHANDTVTLANDLRQLGAVLNLPIHDKDMPTMRRMVLSWLNGGEERWLLLYDNADQITPRDLRPYLPSGSGHLIITSRRDSTQWQRMAQTLTLDMFTAVEATAFWQKRGLKREPALGELAEALGYLPLAMEQAAAFITMQTMDVTDYLAWFKKQRDSLWAEENAPDDYPYTVAATWQISFEHVKMTEGAEDLLNLCCFFAPDDIPLDVIQAGTDILPDGLAVVVADKRKLMMALTALRGYSLLTVVNGMLNIHRLVQTVVQNRMEDKGAWVDATMNVLSKAYRFDPDDTSTWVACGQLIPHMTTIINLATALKLNSVQVASLSNEVGFYFDQYADYVAAMPFYVRALAIYEEQPTSNLSNIASVNNNLGDLLREIGKYKEAKPYYDKALGILKKQRKPDSLKIATVYNNLGLLLVEMKKYAEAKSYYDKALDIRKTKLGPNHPHVAQSLNNLGLLMRAKGDCNQAILYYEKALNNNNEQRDAHPDTATYLDNMGVVLQELGKPEKARKYYQQAREIREQAWGDSHSDTAYSYNNLALLSASEGDMQAATQLMQQALAIWENALGNEHPQTKSARENLSIIKAGLSPELLSPCR